MRKEEEAVKKILQMIKEVGMYYKNLCFVN